MEDLVIESRDLYTYHAVTWYIGQCQHTASSLANVVNARDADPKVLFLARGYGYLEQYALWYTCEESSDAYCTDSRPEPWRRVILKASSRDNLQRCVMDALKKYRDYIATLRANDGMTLYTWDDHDGWVSIGDAPRRTLGSLLLPNNVGETLLDDLKVFLAPETKDRYASLNIPMIKIIMLHGIPGSGKTSLVRCLASELGLNIANFAGDDAQVFSEALMQAPAKCLVSIEDIDCMLGTQGNQREKKGFAQLLNALDAVSRKEPLIVCITTNFPGGLDIAVRRRVDHCVEFKYATKTQGVSLIQRFFPNIEHPDTLWSTLTDNSRRSISMATLQKFLVRSLKYTSPWELLDADPDAFTAIFDVVHPSSTSHHMYM